MIKKINGGIIKGVDEANKRVVVYVSTPAIDRYGEIIEQSGWIFDNYAKLPVLLSCHDYKSLMSQIGKAVNWGVDEVGLWMEFEYFVGQGNMEADWGWRLVQNGVAGYSVGFNPIQWEERVINGRKVKVYVKQELWEVSQVIIPANPDAVLNMIEMGDEEMIRVVQRGLEIILKGAVPPHHSEESQKKEWDKGIAISQLRRWASSDGSGDLDKIDWSKFKMGFGWFDFDNKESVGGYKLPHHYVEGGKLVVCRRGVQSAMAVLFGAMGGVNVPASDKPKIYEHLKVHYEDLGLEVPEFKVYNEDELKEIFGDVIIEERGVDNQSSPRGIQWEDAIDKEEELIIRVLAKYLEELKNKKKEVK